MVDVSGLGCICAAGSDVDACMESMYRGHRAPAPPVRIGVDLESEFPVFEVTDTVDVPNELGSHSQATRTTALLCMAVCEALVQAGLSPFDLAGSRVGVCVGTTVGCTLNNEPFYREYLNGEVPDIEPIERYLANNPALALRRILRLTGPARTIANACSSGTDAIGIAADWIRSGICDIAVAGGADELSRVTCLGFSSMLITSKEACRPFDANRSGLNLGEGAGVVVIENRETLRERGGRSLATVAGYGTASDAYHPTAPHPEGEGLMRAVRAALTAADVSTEEIAFVNAHGTSTPGNDKAEGVAIGKLYGSAPVVSTKAYTGHTLGAAGGIEAVFTVKAFLDGKLPGTAGFETFDEECGVRPTTGITPVDGRYGISHSLAFGGNNSALLIGRAP